MPAEVYQKTMLQYAVPASFWLLYGLYVLYDLVSLSETETNCNVACVEKGSNLTIRRIDTSVNFSKINFLNQVLQNKKKLKI